MIVKAIPILMFSMPGPVELILILLVVLLLFGAKRLPEIARSLGQSIREFKDSFFDRSKRDKDDKNK